MIKQSYFDFDLAEGKRLKEEGMSLARNSYQADIWWGGACGWLHPKPIGYRFTADTVALEHGLPAIPDKRYRNNAFSSWFPKMAQMGYTKDTGERVKSKRKSNHGHEITVWEKIK